MNFRTSNPNQHPDFYYSILRYMPEYMHRTKLPDLMSYSLAMPYTTSESYLGTASDTLKPVLNQNLEGMVVPLGLPSKNDPLDAFLSGKKEFMEKSAVDILQSIQERENIKKENLDKIQYDSSLTKGRLYEIEHWQTGKFSNIDRIRSSIHKELSDFEREKRFEEVACWRDTIRLKTELREVMKELEGEKRRETLLSGE